MRSNLLTGLGLGIVTAVAFASATTGPLLVRFLLFFVTPLPLALAGLGWSLQTAVVAALTAALLVGLAAGPLVGLLFAVYQAVPVVLLTYLALLSRTVPAGPGAMGPIEWYPPGRLVLWAAAISGVLSIASFAVLGAEIDDVRKAIGEFIDKTLRSDLPDMAGGPASLTEGEIKSLADATLAVLPAASAMSWMASLLFNLWLAARVTLASGQLARPWPDLAAIDFPRGTALVFALALLATALGGQAALAASSLAGVLFLAYVLLGLAIIHYTTRGRSWRPFALWALYAALFLINVWIGILVAILGLADTILQLRRRYPPRSGPPASSVIS
jgi:hypothetical protein